jgi:hypothetical protein
MSLPRAPARADALDDGSGLRKAAPVSLKAGGEGDPAYLLLSWAYLRIWNVTGS